MPCLPSARIDQIGADNHYTGNDKPNCKAFTPVPLPLHFATHTHMVTGNCLLQHAASLGVTLEL
jgi:hypothetical protein